MASANSTPQPSPTTPPAASKSQILSDVLSLATQFSTCVEAFNLIHPHKDSNHLQKVALAKLGIQQGRLLIFGDAVGISSPPATIARHMIPSRPGLTNPDPHLPVNFGVRDAQLDEPDVNKKVRAALDEIAGRPAHLSREELMEKYGLKSPKRLSTVEYPALDTNRLEAFREKYALLQDLVRQTGGRMGVKRSGSMTMSHWTVRDVDKFEEFVRTVRVEVDGLIALMGVKEQVDRGMRTDVKAMAWHPDLSAPAVRQDWEKLRLIREACADDYPEYLEVADRALKYISEELRDTRIAGLKVAYQPPPPLRRKSDEEKKPSAAKTVELSAKTPEKEKRPSFFARFSWGKSSRNRSKGMASPPSPSSEAQEDPQRSLSEDIARHSEEENGLEIVRSKSLSAVPDRPAPFDLASRLKSEPEPTLQTIPTNEDGKSREGNGEATLQNVPTLDRKAAEEWEQNPLMQAETARSLIDRHDMYKSVGRIETKDIRGKTHEASAGH